MKNLTYFREKLDTDVDPRMSSRSSQSIKTDIDLSIDKSIKIGKSNLIDKKMSSLFFKARF